MKTLKQQLQAHSWILINETPEEILKIVKAWLEQKRQREPDCDLITTWNTTINEVLKELKGES